MKFGAHCVLFGPEIGTNTAEVLARLAKEPAFALTEAELEAVLEPKRYTGRCAAQVEAFLEDIAPLLAEADGEETPDIHV